MNQKTKITPPKISQPFSPYLSLRLLYFSFLFSILNRLLLSIIYRPLLSRSYLLIHGVIADIFIPLGITALTMYFNRNTLNRFSAWFITFINCLILSDGFHLFHYGFRLNNFLLIDKIWLKFIHSERPAFAVIIALNCLIFFILKKSTDKKLSHKKNPLKILMPATLLIFIVQNISLTANLGKISNWEKYSSFKLLISRSNPEISSFNALLKVKHEDIFPNQLETFFNSHFFYEYLHLYPQLAKNKASKFNLPEENKIWTHRGFHQNLPQNSSSAIKKAIKSGFKGIEIDVRFVPQINKIVICHDPLPFRKLLNKESLTSFLKKLESDLDSIQFIWLDFKNLMDANHAYALKLLKRISKKFQIKEKLYIEHFDPILLRKFSNEGFNTILAIAYGNHSFKFNSETSSIARGQIVLSKCAFVSLPWETFSYASTWKTLASYPVAFYTVNDEKILKRMAQNPNTVGVLTDLEINLKETYKSYEK